MGTERTPRSATSGAVASATTTVSMPASRQRKSSSPGLSMGLRGTADRAGPERPDQRGRVGGAVGQQQADPRPGRHGRQLAGRGAAGVEQLAPGELAVGVAGNDLAGVPPQRLPDRLCQTHRGPLS